MSAITVACPSAKPATLSVSQGPLALLGPREAFAGPRLSAAARFERSGWITRMSAKVSSAAGKSADRLLCYADLHYAGAAGFSKGLELLRLNLTNVQADLSFPKGCGLYVDSEQQYELSFMLLGAQAKDAGSYSVDYEIDFTPDEGAPLKTLRSLTVLTPAPGKTSERFKDCVWPAPGGRHEYRETFVAPEDMEVCYWYFYVQRWVVEVSVLDGDRVLFQGGAEPLPDGWVKRSPSAPAPKPVRLRKGMPYVYRTVCENASGRPGPTMSALRVYFL